MARQLTYCLPIALSDPAYAARPGISAFNSFFGLYGAWVFPVDRTGAMTTPIRTTSLFPVPNYRIFSKSYEEICNDRAVDILKNVETLGVTLYFLYSGGIDSTCVLVSLLKNATPEQKKNIVVLLSHESIGENPRFYEEHIRGRLRTDSSITFPKLLGDHYILSAEHNDLVMGSEKIGKMIARYGAASIYERYSRDRISELFAGILGEGAPTSLYMDIFEKICEKAPVEVGTNMEFLWWINFAFKWQACYYFMLLFTPPRAELLVTQEYLDTRFISFYNTDEFQLWSMNNLDKRIRDTWKSYKWVCKDIIYAYTKDADYRDHKTKNGSLLPLVGYNPPQRFIDDQVHFGTELDLEAYIQPDNNFV